MKSFTKMVMIPETQYLSLMENKTPIQKQIIQLEKEQEQILNAQGSIDRRHADFLRLGQRLYELRETERDPSPYLSAYDQIPNINTYTATHLPLAQPPIIPPFVGHQPPPGPLAQQLPLQQVVPLLPQVGVHIQPQQLLAQFSPPQQLLPVAKPQTPPQPSVQPAKPQTPLQQLLQMVGKPQTPPQASVQTAVQSPGQQKKTYPNRRAVVMQQLPSMAAVPYKQRVETRWLSLGPKQLQSAIPLLDHVQYKDEFVFNDVGELVIDGAPIPKADLVELIRAFTVNSQSGLPVPGIDEFTKLLVQTNVPAQAIGSKFHLARLEKLGLATNQQGTGFPFGQNKYFSVQTWRR